ncbi:uncharacterized protein BDZ99DRAFT_472009 [Mytilinidion resinicola]|uniref:Uncharacterized protein n=1 Tax=Mytilinidion resinicola TaxID=574789 RepID=A0A6A6Z0Q4_9PEZI|nr:uncharacterized protein BDZ99DRAFT_472009 [Mytilinidion resinicola]KAF2814600.1 hypothetical protein BDZ99DRAFT_472009 [Mytilinidion resinicola]
MRCYQSPHRRPGTLEAIKLLRRLKEEFPGWRYCTERCNSGHCSHIDETILGDVVEDAWELADPLALPLEPRRELKTPVRTLPTPDNKEVDVPDTERLSVQSWLVALYEAVPHPPLESEKLEQTVPPVFVLHKTVAVDDGDVDKLVLERTVLLEGCEEVEAPAELEVATEALDEPEIPAELVEKVELEATDALEVAIEDTTLIGNAELEVVNVLKVVVEAVDDEKPPNPPKLKLGNEKLAKLNVKIELETTEVLVETELMIVTEIEDTLDVVVAKATLDVDVATVVVDEEDRDEESTVAELVTAGELVVSAVDEDVATEGAGVRTASQTVGL